MKCIYCGSEDNKVLDSRNSDETNSIRRRRECLDCGRRFTTYETIETTPILVIKNDGSRQSFDREKLKRGIIKSCEKRPVSMTQIENIVTNIEKNIQNRLVQEIKSSQLGEMVMDALKNTDEVSYVRFASVYRQFKDIDSFKKLLEDM